MSQENVDRLRSAVEAYNREGPEAIIALLDPDVEWIADRSDTGRTTYRGLDGVRKSFEELYEGFDRFGFELEELIDVDNRVVALGQMTGRGRSTGVEAKLPMAIVFTAGEDGKLIRYESFRDRHEALAAAGLANRDAEIAAKVRRALDAFSRGDFDAALLDAHPEIELIPAGGQAHKGAADVRAWMEPDAFESQVIEPLDIRVVGNKVLIRTRTQGKGARSGIELDALAWGVWTFDEAGLVTRIEVYLVHQEAEALAAAGLSE